VDNAKSGFSFQNLAFSELSTSCSSQCKRGDGAGARQQLMTTERCKARAHHRPDAPVGWVETHQPSHITHSTFVTLQRKPNGRNSKRSDNLPVHATFTPLDPCSLIGLAKNPPRIFSHFRNSENVKVRRISSARSGYPTTRVASSNKAVRRRSTDGGMATSTTRSEIPIA
jgi:hypothetical protein